MSSRFHDPLTAKIANFLVEVGIEVLPQEIPNKTFLPGILVNHGRLLVDEAKLTYPADLLHEGGHLAVAPAALRSQLSDEVELPELNMDTVEAASIAWSYAATLHLGLDPRLLFHAEGYLGRSEMLLTTYGAGVYLGANGLEERGMAAMPRTAEAQGVPPYPKMLKWLND